MDLLHFLTVFKEISNDFQMKSYLQDTGATDKHDLLHFLPVFKELSSNHFQMKSYSNIFLYLQYGAL